MWSVSDRNLRFLNSIPHMQTKEIFSRHLKKLKMLHLGNLRTWNEDTGRPPNYSMEKKKSLFKDMGKTCISYLEVILKFSDRYHRGSLINYVTAHALKYELKLCNILLQHHKKWFSFNNTLSLAQCDKHALWQYGVTGRPQMTMNRHKPGSLRTLHQSYTIRNLSSFLTVIFLTKSLYYNTYKITFL